MKNKKKTESLEQSRRILIVEDEVSLRNALRDKLTREDFSTLEAKNVARHAYRLELP